MIGKGAQYLTAAGFGRYRITAASLGSLVMLGKFWLTAATKQAIMDAFLDDGPAVIAATNEYLNGIAASDKAKATALASLINEDPMLVCSLGLNVEGVTMPMYGIKGDGTAYMMTNVVLDQDDQVSLFIKPRTTNSSPEFMFGSRETGTSRAYYFIRENNYSNISYFYNNTRIERTNGVTSMQVIENRAGKCYYDGELIGEITKSNFTTPTQAYLFATWANNGVHSMRWGGHIGHCIIKDKRFMLPHTLTEARAADKCYPQVAKPAGTVGMIDIEHDIFYHNANSSGSFTKETINPDGTPWTPPPPNRSN